MQGKRRDNLTDDIPNPGEYGKDSSGTWYGCPPQTLDDDGLPLIGNLANHRVIEHEDRSITVSPSILITRHNGTQWHGWLERGVWRET